MSNEYRKALIRNPNIFLLENKKLKQAKANNLNNNKPSTQIDDDFWKDCVDKDYIQASNGFNLRKESMIGSNYHMNANLDRIKESKNSTDRKGRHLEEYLTCIINDKLVNDDKLNNEISIESKRAEINNIEPSNCNFSQISNLKIDSSSIKTPVEDNKKFSVNPSEKEGKMIYNIGNTRTSNEINTQGSRNIQKTLYDNNNTSTKMTREEKFHSFLTKYSQNSLTETEEMKSKSYIRSIRAQERCYLLHEKSKIKNEVISLIYEKNNELKLIKEMSECTFQPRTNSLEYLKTAKEITTNDYIKKSDNINNFYERSVLWKKLKNENLDRFKYLKSRNDAPTFKPKVNTTNYEIFNPKKNLVNDYVTRNYMMRLQKARKEEQVKKSILQNGCKPISSRILKTNNGRANSQENLCSFQEETQGNMGSVIRSLHRSLHAIDFNEED